MKIPDGPKKSDAFKRLDWVQKVKEDCLVSLVERRDFYQQCRLFWMYGTDGSFESQDDDTGMAPPPGNKIWPHIELLTSFLYSQETTRFALENGKGVDQAMMEWEPTMSDALNDEWHTSNSDIVFGLALMYGLVYSNTHIKPVWRRDGIYPAIVMPHNFGVYREDIMGLSKQEAYVHCFTMSESQFENEYSALPNFKSILKQVQSRAPTQLDQEITGVDKIIMSSQDPLSGNGTGQVNWLEMVSMNYLPRVRGPLVDLYELYAYDDSIKDYRIFTMAAPFIPLFDRPLKQCGWLNKPEPNFIPVIPNPDPNYYWGISEVERLMPLQVARNRYMAQIEHLQELQAHPPSTSSGFPGDLLELQYVLDSPNGMLNNPDPAGLPGGARAERVQISIPEDLYVRIDRVDQMFEDMSGLPAITQGKSVSGVRSGGHASELAKLGSSRAKKRALIVEDILENYATVIVKIKQKYDDTKLTTDKGEKFVANQYTDDFQAKVDAHSSSPIFADDLTALLMQLLKMKAIDREELIRMLPQLPNRRRLLYVLKTRIMPAEQKAAEEQAKLEQARAASKSQGRPGKPNGAHPSGPPGG